MRLVGFAYQETADDFRSDGGRPPVREIYSRLDSFVGIIGPNDTGKSHLLRLLRQALAPPADPAPTTVLYATVDADEFRAISNVCLNNPDSHPGTWCPSPWLDLGDPDLSDPRDPISAWAAHLVSTAPAEDRTYWTRLLRKATGATGRSELLIALEPASHVDPTWNVFWCIPPFEELPDELQDAAKRVGVAGHRSAQDVPFWSSPFVATKYSPTGDDDFLFEGSAPHRCRVEAPIIVAPVGRCSRQWAPVAIELPVQFSELRRKFESAVAFAVSGVVSLAGVLGVDGDFWGVEDGWLRPSEETSEVHPLARSLVKGVERLANKLLLPSIRDTYRVCARINPPHRWVEHGKLGLLLASNPERSDDEELQFQIESVAEGYKLWLQLALAEATSVCTDLADAAYLLSTTYSGEVQDPGDVPVGGIWESDEAVRIERVHELAVSLVKAVASVHQDEADLDVVVPVLQGVDPTVGQRIYLLDEPERHLHPKAQREAARWMEDFVGTRAVQAVVATHSVPFLNLRDAQYLYLVRGRMGTITQDLDPASLTAMDAIAEELGLDRGFLLALTNVILWVEGAHDQAVIEELFGAELRTCGVTILPMNSTSKRQGVLAEEVLLRFTTAKPAVCFDNISDGFADRLVADPGFAEKAKTDKQRSSEERDLADLFLTARRLDRDLTVLGHPFDDIFFLLDEDVIRDEYEGYRTHAHEQELWISAGLPDGARKEWRRQHFGVPYDAATFRRLAARMRALGRRPPALAEIVEQVERLALSGNVTSS